MKGKNLKPFEPKGDEPQWKSLFDVVKDREDFDVLPYKTLNEICGLDIRKFRTPIYECNKRLLKHAKKMLINERGEGYYVAPVDEHIDHAKHREKRAGRQLKHAVRELNGLDKSKMTPAQITYTSELLDNLSIDLQIIRSSNKGSISVMKKAQSQTKDAIQKQETALARIENMMNELNNMKKNLED